MNEKSAAMRNFRTEICAASLLAATSFVALAQSPSGTAVPVTVDNYNRAQSDVYFGLNIERGGFGKFRHLREAVCGIRPRRRSGDSHAARRRQALHVDAGNQ